MFRKITGLKPYQILLIYILIAVLIRLPFFFRDYVDHDESTFIIMGQALVDGHLPYLKLWDLKPPLVFYFFAGIIALFGKSFIAIRLIGSIIVGLTAFFTFRISELLTNRKPSFFAGLITVYLLSLFGALQGVMSEHLAALPLVWGIYILMKNNSSSGWILSGFLFGLAIMFRLNLAYAVFFIYAYALFQDGNFLKGINKGFLLTLGSFVAFFLVFCPYLFTGNLNVLWNSVFKASLAYSNVDLSDMMKTLPFVLILTALCITAWKFLNKQTSNVGLMLIIVMILGQAFMFFKSGKINGHYLIQVFPFLAVLFCALLWKLRLKKFQKYAPAALTILFLLLPVESYMEWKTLFVSKKESGTFFNGEGNTIPAYLTEKYGSELPKNILFLNEHIGYWNLNTYPPTAISTHPSNIFRSPAYPFVPASHKDPVNELKFIFEEIRPNFVVYDEKRIPVAKDAEEFIYCSKNLNKNYMFEKEFGKEGRVKLFRLNYLPQGSSPSE